MPDVTVTCATCKTVPAGAIPGDCLNCYWIEAYRAKCAEAADLRKESDEATSDLKEVRRGYVLIDRNWAAMHESAMGAIRESIGFEASVPQICHFIARGRKVGLR